MHKFNIDSLFSKESLHLGHGRPYSARPRKARELYVDHDHLFEHVYCIGSTGSGKSRMLQHIIEQILEHRMGGLCLIDPHGDLYRVALNMITNWLFGPEGPSREKLDSLGDRYVVFDPGDDRHSIGLNLLEVPHGERPYTLVDELIMSFRNIWGDSWGARMEDVMRNSFLLLQEHGLTLVEMPRLLQDEAFRQYLVLRCKNDEVKMYWRDHFERGLRPYDKKTWVESTRNKISAFVSSPFIRPIIGQSRSTVDFKDAMDKGKIVLVNLSRNKLKDSRSLMGALLVSRIYMAAISREELPPDERRSFFLIVDEFQEFFTETFVHILESGRKYGLACFMAHQNLVQPPFNRDPAFVETILSNTHTHLVFNVSERDAQRLVGELWQFHGDRVKYQKRDLWGPIGDPRFWSIQEEREAAITELTTQGRREFYLNLKGKGYDEPFIAVSPEVPDVPWRRDYEEALKMHSFGRYAKPRGRIQDEIRRRREAIEDAMTGAAP